jgi:hypothetical protein
LSRLTNPVGAMLKTAKRARRCRCAMAPPRGPSGPSMEAPPRSFRRCIPALQLESYWILLRASTPNIPAMSGGSKEFSRISDRLIARRPPGDNQMTGTRGPRDTPPLSWVHNRGPLGAREFNAET